MTFLRSPIYAEERRLVEAAGTPDDFQVAASRLCRAVDLRERRKLSRAEREWLLAHQARVCATGARR